VFVVDVAFAEEVSPTFNLTFAWPTIRKWRRLTVG